MSPKKSTRHIPTSIFSVIFFTISSALGTATVNAEDKDSLIIELNAIQQIDTGCRMIFTAQNSLKQTIEQLSLETVLFDGKGSIAKLTLFNFQSIPNNKLRVRQFDLPETDCGDLSRILINGIEACKGIDLDEKVCLDQLSVKSLTNVELLG
ncbi:MAG: hypothetical protein JJ858_11590 [Rhizobiaceae bacterium]|nr:hypothetical protein [Rhizobiaceae bacterium]